MPLVPRLRRVIRQAAERDRQAGRSCKLEGAQGELDRNVLERMTAPLEHMLRNAVAHGLEIARAARRKAGKADEGSHPQIVGAQAKVRKWCCRSAMTAAASTATAIRARAPSKPADSIRKPMSVLGDSRTSTC